MCSNMGDILRLHFRTSTEALDDNISSLKKKTEINKQHFMWNTCIFTETNLSSDTV